jgi:hypothetical protein
MEQGVVWVQVLGRSLEDRAESRAGDGEKKGVDTLFLRF